MEQAENRESIHAKEIEKIHQRYNLNKDDHSHLQNMCERLSENAAADRAEIERLRVEKYEKSSNPIERSTPPVVNELLYMPVLTNTQKDMILDIQEAQKRN